MADDMFGQPQPSANYIDEYVPPQADPVQAAPVAPVSDQPAGSPAQPAAEGSTQSLEDQNIFTLLGVEDGTEAEKEGFLDELQQVIWEDFLDNDVELLLTEQEMADLKLILDKKDVPDLQKQEEAVVFLEKLIPDLEEIMLEKALELKEAMVRERLAGLKDFYSNDPSKNEAITQAETAMNQGQWQDAAKTMNGIK